MRIRDIFCCCRPKKVVHFSEESTTVITPAITQMEEIITRDKKLSTSYKSIAIVRNDDVPIVPAIVLLNQPRKHKPDQNGNSL